MAKTSGKCRLGESSGCFTGRRGLNGGYTAGFGVVRMWYAAENITTLWIEGKLRTTQTRIKIEKHRLTKDRGAWVKQGLRETIRSWDVSRFRGFAAWRPACHICIAHPVSFI